MDDILKVQVEIDRVTMNLNQIEGQLGYLSNQIDLSTITVTLQEPEPVGGETGTTSSPRSTTASQASSG